MQGLSANAEELLRRQNPDGGWGYSLAATSRRQSWTEPTALAVLALQAEGVRSNKVDRAISSLLKYQRVDGGWAPCLDVDQSTGVTSFAYLAVSDGIAAENRRSAVDWLLHQVKPDLNALERFQFWRTGMPDSEYMMGGSPWYPGTSSWTVPTAMAILAFAEANRHDSRPEIQRQIARGVAYLRSRRCPDGGWHHGGTQFRSQAAPSYPETTGMALLALPSPENLQKASSFLQNPGSSEGESWLVMALRKHGQPVSPARALPNRTIRDLALAILAQNADSPGNKVTRNRFA